MRESPLVGRLPFSTTTRNLMTTLSFSGSHLGLTITSTLQGCFVYWKGLEPAELLEYDSCLVSFMQELPFQDGKPFSPISKEGEGSIMLLEYSHTADNSLDRQVYMASLRNADDDEPGPEYDAKLLVDVSADERTVAPPRMRMRSTEGSGD
jgi:hypothetical protein